MAVTHIANYFFMEANSSSVYLQIYVTHPYFHMSLLVPLPVAGQGDSIGEEYGDYLLKF